MKYAIVLTLVFNLSGCAGYAAFANSQDPCQKTGKAEGYTRPSWCGASTGHNVTIVQGLSRNNYIVTVK